MSSIRTNFIEKFSDDNEYSFQEECAREFLEGDIVTGKQIGRAHV